MAKQCPELVYRELVEPVEGLLPSSTRSAMLRLLMAGQGHQEVRHGSVSSIIPCELNWENGDDSVLCQFSDPTDAGNLNFQISFICKMHWLAVSFVQSAMLSTFMVRGEEPHTLSELAFLRQLATPGDDPCFRSN
jgi:hypothetical protein